MNNFEKLKKAIISNQYISDTSDFELVNSKSMKFNDIIDSLVELENHSIKNNVNDKFTTDIGIYIENIFRGIFQIDFMNLGEAQIKLRDLGINRRGAFFDFPYSSFMIVKDHRNDFGHNKETLDIDTLRYLLRSSHKILLWSLLAKTFDVYIGITGTDVEYLKETLTHFKKDNKWLSNDSVGLAKSEADKVEEVIKDFDLDNIQATKTTAFELVKRDNIHFHIPDYQRKYVWAENQIDTLIDDIENSMSKGRAHYFGVIAQRIVNDNGVDKAIIIDGQQRLTTSILLLKSLQLLLLKGKYKDDEVLKELNQVFEKFIGKNSRYFNESWDSEETKYEYESFKMIISWDGGKILNPEKYNNTRYFKNVLYMRDKLAIKYNEDYKIKALHNHIFEKLVIVTLAYDADAMDEMEIFESLNAKGTILSNLDLIKNFMLSKLRTEDRSECNKEWENSLRGAINKYKKDMFGKTKNQDEKIIKVTDDFLLMYLKYTIQIKFGIDNEAKENKYILNKDTIYPDFKLLITTQNGRERISKDAFMNVITDLRKCFSIYYTIKIPSEAGITKKDSELKTVLELLSSKDIHTSLALMLFNKYGTFTSKNWLENEESEGVVLSTLKTTLIYLLRLKLITGDGQSLGPKILKFTKELNLSNDLNVEKVVELFKKQFPEIKTQLSDEALYEQLKTSNVLHGDSALHCLLLLENYMTNEEEGNGWLWNNNRSKKPDKEHIMPVEFVQHWRKDMKSWNKSVNDKNIAVKHSKFIDMIGNYLPLYDKLNKSAKNNNFEAKKPKYEKNTIANISGNQEIMSGVKKIKKITELDSWTFEDIEVRSEVYAYIIAFKILTL